MGEDRGWYVRSVGGQRGETDHSLIREDELIVEQDEDDAKPTWDEEEEDAMEPADEDDPMDGLPSLNGLYKPAEDEPLNMVSESLPTAWVYPNPERTSTTLMRSLISDARKARRESGTARTRTQRTSRT